MSEDIVERLRVEGWGENVTDTLQRWTDERREAADEIERLRAAAGGEQGGEGLSGEALNTLARIAQRFGMRGTEEQIEEVFRQSVLDTLTGGERGGEQASPSTETANTSIT